MFCDFICISFSFGDTTESKCMLTLSLQIQGNDKGNVWKKKPQNTLIFKTSASTPNKGLLLQHLLAFHNLIIAKAYG